MYAKVTKILNFITKQNYLNETVVKGYLQKLVNCSFQDEKKNKPFVDSINISSEMQCKYPIVAQGPTEFGTSQLSLLHYA